MQETALSHSTSIISLTVENAQKWGKSAENFNYRVILDLGPIATRMQHKNDSQSEKNGKYAENYGLLRRAG